jgi:predicted dinucleotide-binding enzyme
VVGHLCTKLTRRSFCRASLFCALVAAAVGAQPANAFAQTAATGALKIATIGAGREGGALGTLFAKHGHPVMFSSRHPEQLKDLVASAGPNAAAGTVEQAIAFADVVLLVVPYTAIEQVGRDYGTALRAKQLIIDVSNPIASRDGNELVARVEQEGGPGLATLKMLGGGKIVRALNAIGFARLPQESHRPGEPAGVPIAGDDANAIELASKLITEIGFEPVLVGGLAMGKHLVPGTPLAGVHTPAEIRQIASTLK